MKKFIFGFLAALSLLAAPAAHAEVVPPSQSIKSTIEEVQRLVKTNAGKLSESALDEKLKALIFPMFNFEEMSRRSLGAFWNKATPDEQKEFVTWFSDLLASTYLKRIKRNASDSDIKEISDQITDNKAFVRSIVVSSGDSVSIDYRLLLESSQWKIYDVVIENVGLVSNYRNEFPAIIRKDGFPGLLKKLKEKKVTPTSAAEGA